MASPKRGNMSSPNSAFKSAVPNPLLQSMLDQKPATLIAGWKEQFRSLAAEASSKMSMESELGIEIQDEPHLENGWKIMDKSTGRCYVVAKRTTTKTVKGTMEFYLLRMSELKVLVSLALPAEGPLGQNGVEGFDEYAFWPQVKNETRKYSVHSNGKAVTLIHLRVDTVKTIDDESIISIISSMTTGADQKQPETTPPAPDDPSYVSCLFHPQLHHIQQLNWPPDGYPPMCTFSLLRIMLYIHGQCRPNPVSSTQKSQVSCILITCSDGSGRSAAMAALCCAISQLDNQSTKIPPGQIMYELVKAIRLRRPSAIQHQSIYLWLQYAMIEWIYTIDSEILQDKDRKGARGRLLKLRKAVYEAANAETNG